MKNEFVIVGIDSEGEKFIYSVGSEYQCKHGVKSYEKTFCRAAEVMSARKACKMLKSKTNSAKINNISPTSFSC